MTKDEAFAYKLALIWIELCRQELPNYQHVRLKKGDPRKSILWKYCYKLYQETKGLVLPKEYRYYILAQLRILKAFKQGNIHALIEPSILTGRKAWWRWTNWKKRFDKNIEISMSTEQLKAFAPEYKIIQELEETHEFMKKAGLVTKDAVLKAIDSGMLPKWAHANKIVPYYLVLSPWANVKDDLDKIFNIDLMVYRRAITNEIREFFKDEFVDEFKQIP